MLRLLSLLLEVWNLKIYITYQCVACFCQMNVCRCAEGLSDSGVYRLVSKTMAMLICKTDPTCETQTACKAASFAITWNMHQHLRLHVFQQHRSCRMGVHEPRQYCRYEDLLTLLFICLHNLVPGACTALQASKHPFVCAPCKSASDFCCIEIGHRRCLVKVSWQALHFCRCCSLYRLQTFSPVSWDVLPDTLHGYQRCGSCAAENPREPHSKGR